MPKGENKSKLSLEVAKEIRKLYYTDDTLTQKKIAEMYGVSQNAINLILANKNYKENK